MHGKAVCRRGRAGGPVLADWAYRPRLRRVDFLVGLLAEQAETLSEPYTRHLGGKVRELRFHLLAQQTRVTYWLAPGRRVILLTVFHKTRSAETAEVTRAVQTQKTCEAEHGPAHTTFDREVP
jgi:phage-related protein